MPNVSLFNEYSAEDQAIARRRKMAEMLQQQSMTPLESQSANGWVIPTSPLAGLAKLLQSYSAGKMTSAADEQQKALGQRYQSEGQDARVRGLRAYRGTPENAPESVGGEPAVGPTQPAVPGSPEAAMGILGGHPATQGASQAMLAQLLKGEEDYSLGEGAKRMRGSKVLAENPKQQPGFNLTHGGARFGPDGKLIASLPEKIDYNKAFLSDGSPNRAYQEYALSKARAGKSSVNVNMAQEKEFEKELGKEQAKSLVEGRKNADDAAQIINTVNVGRKIMKSGMVTGFGANAIVSIGQALKQAGIDFGGDATANAQAYSAAMAQNVGKIIKQFGSGTGLSDADREYAIRMAGGQITLDKAAITKILDINEKAARNVLKTHNRRAEGVQSNIPLKVDEPQTDRLTPQEQQELDQLRARFGRGR